LKRRVTHSFTSRRTAGVSGVWAGVDNAWEQEKLEARKMLENAADSHTSGARFVSPRFYHGTSVFNSFSNLQAPLSYC
jgi:hypothetical protein